MKHFYETVANKANVLLQGATVTIFVAGTSTLAPLFSDDGVTSKANPLTTNALGGFDFFIADGRYDIQVSGPNVETTTLRSVEISDITDSSPSDVSWQTKNLNFVNQPSDPPIPAAGTIQLYTKGTNKHIFIEDDAGTITDLTTAGGGGGGTLPGNPTNSLQKNSGLSTFAGSNVLDDGMTVSVLSDIKYQGPNPYTDVRAFGVRDIPTTVAPAVPGITSTINSGSSSVVLSSASAFQNGDGVVIFGAGSTASVTTPTSLIVSPSISTGGAGTGLVVNGPAGSTSYAYQIIARTKQGGLSAASSIAITTTGAAVLGPQNVAISSFTRSGSTVTAITSTPHGLAVGAAINVVTASSTDNGNFGGWFVVSSAPDTLHFSYTTGQDILNGAPATSNSGGTVYWFNCNHLTWDTQPNAFEYYIYGRNSGSLNYLGTSRPQRSGLDFNVGIDPTFDDFGSPAMDGAVAPYFVPLTPPTSTLANPLVTKILSGAGTSTLTLANSASTSVSGATILFDNTPNIATAAAATQFGSLLYFPGGTYVVNSYLTIPTFVSMNLAGASLLMNDTMEIQSSDKLYGMLGAQTGSALSFGYPVGAFINAGRANPAVYASCCGGNYMYGIQFGAGANGGVGLFADDVSNSSFNYLNFNSSGTDVMTIPLIVRAPAFSVSMDHIADVVGQNSAFFGILPTPAFMYSGGSLNMNNLSMSGRGFFRKQLVGGPGIDIVVGGSSRIQGGTQPFFTDYTGNCCEGGSVAINNVELDTMPHALYAQLGAGSVHGLTASNSGTPSNGFGNVTGLPVFLCVGNCNGQNNATVSGQNFTNNAVSVTGNGEFMVPIVNNTAPSVAVSAGGGVPIGTIPYNVTMVDINGNESTVSPSVNAITTSGNQTVTITPPIAPAGAIGWKPYRSNALVNIPNCTFGGFLTFAQNFVDSFGFTCGFTSPTINRAGSQTLGAAGLSGTAINVLGGGFKSAITGTFTAARTLTLPDQSGTLAIAPITPANLSPGINGQCLNTSGSVAIWGSCAGTAGVQLIGIPNTGTVIVNGNTTAFQNLSTACTTAPCYGAGALNSLGKTIDVFAQGIASFINTSEQVIMSVDFGLGPTNVGSFIPSAIGNAQWFLDAKCVTTTTGSSGQFLCSVGTTWRNSGGLTTQVGSSQFFPVNLTASITPTVAVSFSTASTTNIATSFLAMTHQHN